MYYIYSLFLKDLNSTEGLSGSDTRFVKYNGALGPQQIEWLNKKLSKAEESDQKAIIIGMCKYIDVED